MATVLVGACGGDEDSAASAPAADKVAGDSATAGVDGDSAIRSSEETPAGAPVDAGDAGGFDLGSIGRDVIVEMNVTMSSDDIERTVASITASASSLGGGVASSEVDFGDRNDPNASQGFAVLVVKVPPDQIDRLLSGLDSSGEVLRINQTAQDVTEQLVDLDVRIRNAEQSVTNVREFMDRSEDLADLVTLEGELTRRQTELEQLRAQQRNLSDRVALSTITVEVIPTASVPEPISDDESIGDAFRNGWDAFVAMLFGIVFVLALLLPFLVVAAFVLVLVRWIVRSQRDEQVESPPPGDLPDSADVDRETVSVGSAEVPPSADGPGSPTD